MKTEVVEFAEKLTGIAPRLHEVEVKAAEMIKERLSERGLEYNVQKYWVSEPRFKEYWLEADGEEIECLPSGLKSGKVEGKNLINSIDVSEQEKPCITYSPYSEGVCIGDFYRAPALAINPQDIDKIIKADKVEGFLDIEWESFQSQNIIAGNTKDPEKIVMTHYDSLWGSFIDNSFSVSLLIKLIDDEFLENNLIVFAGTEEVANDQPYYCYGYRRFEAKYHNLLKNTDQIFVVDSLGRGEQAVITDEEIVSKAIRFADTDLNINTKVVAGRYFDILDIYHSRLDTKEALVKFDEAVEVLQKNVFS